MLFYISDKILQRDTEDKILQNKTNSINKTAVFLAFATLAQVFGPMPAFADAAVRDCSDFYEFTDGDIAFQNNIWQRNGVAGEQCVTSSGWTWDWPVTETVEVRSYPAAYFGRRPWSQKSTTDKLPLRISALRSLVIDYEIETIQSGVNNTSFDIWISKSATSADGSDRSAEIVIWLRHAPELTPGDTPDGQITVGDEIFDFHFSIKNGIASADFVAPAYKPQGSIDIAKFVEVLSNAYPLASDDYVRSIELGNQIVSGSGSTQILTLKPHVNE